MVLYNWGCSQLLWVIWSPPKASCLLLISPEVNGHDPADLSKLPSCIKEISRIMLLPTTVLPVLLLPEDVGANGWSSGFLEVLLQVNQFQAICFYSAPSHYQIPFSLALWLINLAPPHSCTKRTDCFYVKKGEGSGEEEKGERGEGEDTGGGGGEEVSFISTSWDWQVTKC